MAWMSEVNLWFTPNFTPIGRVKNLKITFLNFYKLK